MSGFEANFDGLVGPTHHYAGLSVGNEASQNNRDGLSNPKKAALQGLYKMKALADRGFVQGGQPVSLDNRTSTHRKSCSSKFSSPSRLRAASSCLLPSLPMAAYRP